MRPMLVFDTETVPDADMARRVLARPDLVDDEALALVAPARMPDQAHGFPKPLYHRVVAISVLVVDASGHVPFFQALAPGGSEAELLQAFWEGLARQAGRSRLVSFNGRGFDIPVLTQRALHHGVSPAAWWQGDYAPRFQNGHVDLMDLLANFGAAQAPSQHEMATLFGLPGKLGVDGGDVLQLWQLGERRRIEAYCSCDVATLALCALRIGPHAGWCSTQEALSAQEELKSRLAELAAGETLYRQFLTALG